MDWLKLVHGASPSTPPAFKPGDEIRVWYRILEQGKERLGQFEGIVIRCRGAWPSKTFTVRRVTYGEGVERTFPTDARTIAKIEVLKRGKTRRSRLYYLRRVVGKVRIASGEETPRAANTGPSAGQAPASSSVVSEHTAVSAEPHPA